MPMMWHLSFIQYGETVDLKDSLCENKSCPCDGPSTCKFICPFCRPELHGFKNHQELQGHFDRAHVLTAVQYKDILIVACNLWCEGTKGNHYHCPSCPKLLKGRQEHVSHLREHLQEQNESQELAYAADDQLPASMYYEDVFTRLCSKQCALKSVVLNISHYHCPVCHNVAESAILMLCHLRICVGKEEPNSLSVHRKPRKKVISQLENPRTWFPKWHKSIVLNEDDITTAHCRLKSHTTCKKKLRYHCPLCVPTNENMFQLIPARSHFAGHHVNLRYLHEGYSFLRCKLDCFDDGGTKGHYHCGYCGSIEYNRLAFRAHLRNCNNKDNTTEPRPKTTTSSSGKVQEADINKPTSAAEESMDCTPTDGVKDMDSADDSSPLFGDKNGQENKCSRPTAPSEIEMFSSVAVTLSRPFIRGFHFATKAAAESLFTEVAGAASVVFNSAPGTNPDDPVFSLKGSHQNILRSETLLRAKFQEVPGNTNTPIKTAFSSGDCEHSARAVKQTDFMEPSHPLALNLGVTLGHTSEITADEMKILSEFLEKKHMLAVLRRCHSSFTFVKQAAPVSEQKGLQVPSIQSVSVGQGPHTNSGQTTESKSLQSNASKEPQKVSDIKGGYCTTYSGANKDGIQPVPLPSAEQLSLKKDMRDHYTGESNDSRARTSAASIYVVSDKKKVQLNSNIQSEDHVQPDSSVHTKISVPSIHSLQVNNIVQPKLSTQSKNNILLPSIAQSNKSAQSNYTSAFSTVPEKSQCEVPQLDQKPTTGLLDLLRSKSSYIPSIRSESTVPWKLALDDPKLELFFVRRKLRTELRAQDVIPGHSRKQESTGTTSVNESFAKDTGAEISQLVIVNELEQHSLTMQDIIGMEREAFPERKGTKCPVCSQEFSKIGTLSLHVFRDHHKFKCPYCKHFYSKKDLLLSHLKQNHASPDQNSQQSCSLQDVKHVWCGDCGKVYLNRQDLDRHQTLRHYDKKREKACFICGEENIAKWMSHVINLHIGGWIPEEGSQPEGSRAEGSRAESSRAEGSQGSFSEGSRALNMCDICGKSYVKLQSHRKRHFMKNKHPCEICGKLFKDKRTVKIHQQIHQPQEQRSFPFMCSFCGKRFCNKGGLNSHLTTHTGERPFSCDQCGKHFRLKGALLKHKRNKHSDERPFQCTLCPKAFKANYVLESHMVTHTGVSDHVCPHCKHPFGTKIYLKSHLPKCKKRERSPSEVNLDVAKKPRNQRGLRKSKKLKTTESEELDDLSFTWTDPERKKVESGEIDGQHVYMCSSCGSTYPDFAQAEKHITTCLFQP